MTRSMLASIRNAMRGDEAEDSPEGVETGAPAPNANATPAGEGKEEGMPPEADQPAAGATATAGISKTDHDRAVSEATETGRAEGAKASTDRMSAILGTEGIKGDGNRMAAALDLAVKSPGMSAEDVTGFVTGSVPAAKTDDAGTQARGYEQERLAATGQSQPSPPQKRGNTINRSEIYASRRTATKEG